MSSLHIQFILLIDILSSFFFSFLQYKNREKMCMSGFESLEIWCVYLNVQPYKGSIFYVYFQHSKENYLIVEIRIDNSILNSKACVNLINLNILSVLLLSNLFSTRDLKWCKILFWFYYFKLLWSYLKSTWEAWIYNKNISLLYLILRECLCSFLVPQLFIN